MVKYIFFVISALPLLISPFLFFPAAWGKAQVFKILMIILIYVFIYYIVFRKIKIDFSQLKKIKILWLFLLLFIFLALSTIFSQNPYFSFWGDPQRGGGALNFTLFLILSLLAFLFLRKNDWQKLWQFNLIVASIVALLAIVIPNDYRAYSTLGGPSILALYLALLIPISLSYFLKTKKKIYLLCSGLFFLAIFLSSTRGVLLGLSAGLIFFILSKKQNLWLKIGAVFLIALLIITAFSLRQVDIKDRASVWIISLKAVKEKPLLGFGPENFSIPFNKYYDSSLPGLNRQWFDRAHNIIFDLAVPYGTPFLITYLLIFIIIFFKVPSLTVKSSIIIYFTANLFNFDIFSTYLIIFLLLAYSMSKIYSNPLVFLETSRDNPFKQVAMALLFILFLYFAWHVSVRPLYINKELNLAKREKNAEKLDNVLTKHSFIDHYTRINYATAAIKIIKANPSLNNSLPLIKKSITALEEAGKIRPKYAKTWYMLNFFSNTLYKYEATEELKEKSQKYCQRAKELSPNHPLIIKECQKTEFLIQ